MPFTIVRNDITQMQVDAIVNTVSPEPGIGLGTDSAIHEKAGPRLLEARKAVGHIAVGTCAATPAFNLDARYVIHTAGPRWRGGLLGEGRFLKKCYLSAMNMAVEKGCCSIAFPLLSAGSYGFPKDKALQIAISAFSEFLTEQELQIYLVVFNKEAFQLSEKLMHRVQSFVDDHYVEQSYRKEYGNPIQQREQRRFMSSASCASAQMREDLEEIRCESSTLPLACPSPAPAKALSLEELLRQEDVGFSEDLLRRIDQTGKKDSEIYRKANLSKQHFSKIRNNPDYKPSKLTAVSFALALELDLKGTLDLIGRADYTLSSSDKLDIILQYFIENKNYNLFEIDAVLFQYDLQPIHGE
jgi:O-acetyl-ADP-ribose deacetylase (regulator of RNase III)